MKTAMDKSLMDLLKIDAQAEKGKIIQLIREKVKLLNKDGVVLGLSGGLDSSACAYLLSEALGKEKILGGMFFKNNAFSLTKVRTRMLHLYYYAWLHIYAVIGTVDKSEYSIGLYDPHGDGACDLAILRHLYKSQIKQLATGIGVPKIITQKKSSGNLYGNEAWEDAMGLTYEQLDQVLLGLDMGYPEKELVQIIDKEGIEAIKKGKEVSAFIRSLPIALA